MRNTLAFILCVLFLNSFATAAEHGIFSDSSKSPYQTLAALFKKARPTLLKEMLTPNADKITHFQSIKETVFRGTRRSDIQVSDQCWTVTTVTKVPVSKTEPVPGTNDGGPLFPGVADVQSVTTYRQTPYKWSVDCNAYDGWIEDVSVAKVLGIYKYKIEETKDGLMEIYHDYNNIKEGQKYLNFRASVFRTYGEYIIEKILYVSYDEKGNQYLTEGYNYFWKYKK